MCWWNDSSSVLRMAKERSQCSHTKKLSELRRVSKSLFTSHGDTWGWIVYCLLCTRTGKRPSNIKTKGACHITGVSQHSNGNGEAPVGIANILSRVLLLLQVTGWVLELVQRITLLISLPLMGEVWVGCVAWMLCTSGFMYGSRGWGLCWSMCLLCGKLFCLTLQLIAFSWCCIQ